MGLRKSSPLRLFAVLVALTAGQVSFARSLNSCEGGAGGTQPLSGQQLPLLGQGYECRVTLFHSEDFKKRVGERVIRLKSGESEAGIRSLGELFVESARGNRSTRIHLKGVIHAWPGDEDALFVLVRSQVKGDRLASSQVIGRTSTLSGTGKMSAWIDTYKLDVSCRILGLPEVAGDGRGGYPIEDGPFPSPTPPPSPVPGDGRGGHDSAEHV